MVTADLKRHISEVLTMDRQVLYCQRNCSYTIILSTCLVMHLRPCLLLINLHIRRSNVNRPMSDVLYCQLYICKLVDDT